MQIVKLGGSTITKKHGYMEADELNINRLAQAIAAVWKKGVTDIVLVHGAGSFGHAPVLAYGINDGIKTPRQKLAFADTHAACAYLSQLVVDALIKNDVPAISLPPTAIIRQRNHRIVKFDKETILQYLKKGFVPVLYGDMVLDDTLGGSVCSGDQIVSILGKGASRVIHCSNVDGVLVQSKVVQLIDRKNLKDIAKHLKGAGAPDVSGGMEGKINEMVKAKTHAFIINGNKPDRLEAILMGKKTICTEIRM
ncbi:MAG: isopentenyl phosphate kinase [Candidatus Micrarchaeota archaeon]|mgnify:CR=1 FL=1